MNPISTFFDKFKNILATSISERQAVSDAVFAVLNIRIEPKTIVIRDGIADVHAKSPVLRTELRLKRSRILDEIRSINQASRISDIR